MSVAKPNGPGAKRVGGESSLRFEASLRHSRRGSMEQQSCGKGGLGRHSPHDWRNLAGRTIRATGRR